MAAYLQVVLRESLKNLGKSGDLVRVRPGFARNYLVPRALAVYATEGNVARLEHEKREALARAAKLKGEHEALAKKLEGVTVIIARKVGADDRMYGSVTPKDVAEGLAKLGHEIDRRKIELGEPIKSLGTHSATLRFAAEATSSFKVEVVKALVAPLPRIAPRCTSVSRGAVHLGAWGKPGHSLGNGWGVTFFVRPCASRSGSPTA
jgi:large subunit ribosomal protein L9